MFRKNTAGQFIGFQLLLTATGAIATGLSPTVRRCIDGTFAAGGGTVTEDTGTGGYKYAMSQADTNGNDIQFWFSAATAIPVCINVVTTAADPTNAATFGITDIDAAISSRMATYTQPTGFLSATFPSGTVANTTNITAGTIATVTTLTNLPAITAGWLTATGIAAAALNGKGDWNIGKTGYSLSVTPPTAAAVATAVWTDTTAGDFTTASSIGKSIMNGVALGTGLTINGYTGDTPQSGDAYARLGVAGVGLTNLGDTRIANLDTTVSSRTKPADTQAAVTTVTNLTNLPSIPANWLTATGITAGALSGKGDWPVGKTGYSISGTITTLDGLATHGDSAWATATGFATPTNITAGTITTVTNLTNAPTAGDLTATMKTSVTTAATAATPTVTAGTVSDKTGYALTSGEHTSVADAILDRDMSIGTDSGSTTVRTVRQALRFLRNKWAIVTDTLTVYKEDDTTSSWASSVTTDGSALPIISNDPEG